MSESGRLGRAVMAVGIDRSGFMGRWVLDQTEDKDKRGERRRNRKRWTGLSDDTGPTQQHSIRNRRRTSNSETHGGNVLIVLILYSNMNVMLTSSLPSVLISNVYFTC